MKRHEQSQETVAELRDVHFIGDGDAHILRGVSLAVQRRERLLIAGPSGSGKTTLVNTLTDIVKPTTGDVLLFGQSLPGMSERKRKQLIHDRVAIGFQAPNLDTGMTLRQNILSLQETTRKGRASTSRMGELLLALGLEKAVDREAHLFSGGEKHRAALARLLLPAPELIVLDEPTDGLDSTSEYSKEHTFNVIGWYAQETDATVIVVSHDAEAVDFASRQVNVRDGLIQEPAVPVLPIAA